MRYHRKLLAFLAAWFATIGVAFLLSNLEVFAANCNACQYCETFHYAALYADGTVNIAEGFFDPTTGSSEIQAFNGTKCSASGDLYQAGACGSDACAVGTIGELSITPYTVPNWTCTLPAGAEPSVREFNGGTVGKPLSGRTVQKVCFGT